MLPDETRRRLRKLNWALIEARQIIEEWPKDQEVYHLCEWQSALDDMMTKVVEYQGPNAQFDGSAAPGSMGE